MSLPIMVKSRLCDLYNNTVEELIQKNEDPTDQGGYFIIGGKEWAIESIESILYNSFHVRINMFKTEIARGILISKEGDGFDYSY